MMRIITLIGISFLAVYGFTAMAARIVPTERIEHPSAPQLTAPSPIPDIAPYENEAVSPSIDAVIEYDADKLPEPVQLLRDNLIKAAKTGDIEALRPLFEATEEPPLVSVDDVNDEILHLKEISGDAEGREVLAILLELLESGWTVQDKGTEDEIYVWPYFVATPLDTLTSPQLVELFRLLTAVDYEDMQSYGAYVFYRIGITPQGELKFFLSGD